MYHVVSEYLGCILHMRNVPRLDPNFFQGIERATFRKESIYKKQTLLPLILFCCCCIVSNAINVNNSCIFINIY